MLVALGSMAGAGVHSEKGICLKILARDRPNLQSKATQDSPNAQFHVLSRPRSCLRNKQCPSDVADDPAQPAAQNAQLPLMPLELFGVGVTACHHRGGLGRARGILIFEATTRSLLLRPGDS